ncbi:MAG TPA: ATP-binding protein [Polyangiaceae bacterium]|nr:ATP-binding protein [Polyangiaceae bacterium]
MSSSGQDRQAREISRAFRDERQHWRERTLQGLLLSVSGAGLYSAAWQALLRSGIPGLTRTIIVAALIIGFLAVPKWRLPFTLRANLFLGTLFLGCFASTVFVGFHPTALVGFVTVAVSAALLFGLTAAIIAASSATLAILFITLTHSYGLLHRAENWSAIMDSGQLVSGLRMTGVFGLLCASSVVGISYLLKRSETLAWEQAKALEALRHEQLEKEKLRRDLELREAALVKARELETLGRLAGSMAHDFNNALLLVHGAIDELASGESDHGEVIATLRAAADQASATTRSLRAFGPLGPRRTTTLSVTALITKAVTTLARVLPPNIALDSDVQIEAMVAADEGELLRVLTNLALNARDAMREGGKLLLRVRAASATEEALSSSGTKFVAIEVADTGVGIPDDVKERLFEPFFTTKKEIGTGLGLATVRDIARAHSGHVAVASQLGGGTTITLLWPLSPEAPKLVTPRPSQPAHDGVVILLVDDDPGVLSVLGRNLERSGFSVIRASDASAGVEAIRRAKANIDLLCTDWVMPGRPVRQLIEEYRRAHGGPVLVCSGYAPVEDELSNSVCDDFLAKPFTGQELLQRVRALLDKAPRQVHPGRAAG